MCRFTQYLVAANGQKRTLHSHIFRMRKQHLRPKPDHMHHKTINNPTRESQMKVIAREFLIAVKKVAFVTSYAAAGDDLRMQTARQ